MNLGQYWGRVWQYYFYLDFEAGIKDERSKKILEKIHNHVNFMRILGSYKQGILIDTNKLYSNLAKGGYMKSDILSDTVKISQEVANLRKQGQTILDLGVGETLIPLDQIIRKSLNNNSLAERFNYPSNWTYRYY